MKDRKGCLLQARPVSCLVVVGQIRQAACPEGASPSSSYCHVVDQSYQEMLAVVLQVLSLVARLYLYQEEHSDLPFGFLFVVLLYLVGYRKVAVVLILY